MFDFLDDWFGSMPTFDSSTTYFNHVTSGATTFDATNPPTPSDLNTGDTQGPSPQTTASGTYKDIVKGAIDSGLTALSHGAPGVGTVQNPAGFYGERSLTGVNAQARFPYENFTSPKHYEALRAVTPDTYHLLYARYLRQAAAAGTPA